MRLDELKLSEVAEIERLGGRSIASLSDDDVPRGRMLQAIATVMKKRENPNFKFEDAGEFTMDEALRLITGTDDEDYKSNEAEE